VYSSKFCVELGTDPWLTSTLKQVDIKQMVVQQQQHERQLASAASATAAEGVVPALFASPPGAGAAAAGAAGCRRGSAASPSEEIEAGLSLTGVFGSLAPSPALSAAAAAGQYAAGYGVAPPRGLSAEPWEELDEQDFDFASLPSEPCGSWDFPWSPSPARREGSGAELGEAGMAGGEARGGAAGSPTPHGGHSAGLEPGAAGASRGAGCAGPGVQQWPCDVRAALLLAGQLRMRVRMGTTTHGKVPQQSPSHLGLEPVRTHVSALAARAESGASSASTSSDRASVMAIVPR